MKLKKLNLNVVTFGASEVLSREELKKISGGSGTCGAFIPSNPNTSINTGSYTGSYTAYGTEDEPAYQNSDTGTVWRGIDKETALSMTNGISGAKWCCDSCSSASWY